MDNKYTLIQLDYKKRSDVAAFVEFPFKLYDKNGCWVPPIKNKQISLLMKGEGMQLSGGDYALFSVMHENETAGRLLVGINYVKNKQRNLNEGYFSLFECVNDKEAAQCLIEGAKLWLKSRKAESFTGPVSPTNGDDNRGVLTEGFDRMPTVNTAYTMSYYPELLEACGLVKYLDFYAFDINFDNAKVERVKKVVEFGKRKAKLDIRALDTSDIKGEADDIYNVLMKSMRSQWEHLEIPTYEQLLEEFSSLKNMIDPELIYIARINNESVGFVAGIPDYNQVLCKLNGKLNAISIFKYLYYKKRITRVKYFMQFVIPKYQGTFVLPSLYLRLYEGFLKKGYEKMECATVAEINLGSLNTLEGVGFEKCMSYRIYKGTL